MVKKETTHIAPGPSFGFLFQVNRALVLLAKAKRDHLIGFEVDDDTSVQDNFNSTQTREQAKTSIATKPTNPYSDRSEGLWKTIYIWVKAYVEGEFELSKIHLNFLTNTRVSKKSLIWELSEAQDHRQAKQVLRNLKLAIKDPPESLSKMVKYVLDHENSFLKLIPKIHLFDNLTNYKNDQEIIDKLHLTEEFEEDILTSLKGWVQSEIIKKLENKELALIERKRFDRQLYLYTTQAKLNKTRVRVKKFVMNEIPSESKKTAEDDLFVKQLDAIFAKEKLPDQNLILDAINDYLCTEIEKVRLINEGEILEEHFANCEEECISRWRRIFRRFARDFKGESLNNSDLKEIGYNIYDHTLDNFSATLDGQALLTYFSNGTFHKLANKLKIGWHPEWEEIFSKIAETDESQ